MGAKMSESKFVLLCCKTAVILSSPIPVSMLGFGSGVSLPDSSLLNCMKTRFQSSKYLSQSHPAMQSGFLHPKSPPWSMMISEHGPHGPVSPICQKLSFAPSLAILSSGSPINSDQSFTASSSSIYTETWSLSLGNLNHSVKNSQAKVIASSL